MPQNTLKTTMIILSAWEKKATVHFNKKGGGGGGVESCLSFLFPGTN